MHVVSGKHRTEFFGLIPPFLILEHYVSLFLELFSLVCKWSAPAIVTFVFALIPFVVHLVVHAFLFDGSCVL